jgi:hypothetical protein
MYQVVLLTLHLLGVGTLIGVVVLTLLFLRAAAPVNIQVLPAIRKIGMYGAILAIVAGILMAIPRYSGLLTNPLFLTKLALVLADGVIAERIIKHFLEEADLNNPESLRKKLLPWAWLSLAIVVAIVAISVYRSKF